jgi:hypothetical protein
MKSVPIAAKATCSGVLLAAEPELRIHLISFKIAVVIPKKRGSSRAHAPASAGMRRSLEGILRV